MPRFLIRAEAVNFDWACFDTQDLSTIRGGSMMLMNAHELISGAIPQPDVYGASQAIWSFNAVSLDTAETQRRLIETTLRDHAQLKHTTFVVDLLEATNNDPQDQKTLRMLNRWHQFQQPTLAVPEASTREPEKARRCELDFVRPQTTSADKGDETYWVSASVNVRREYGKTQKQNFYRPFLPEIAVRDLEFANDLDHITSREHCDKPDPLRHLHNKMAVIYFDGNKQGEMATELGLSDLAEFRSYTRDRQKEFLAAVLQSILSVTPVAGKSDEWYYWNANQEKHLVRLETVLWGGDDILLVVPAWKGWEVVTLFFDHVTGKATGNPWKCGDTFSYSAGMVFCSHKASIHRMRALAESLFIQGKKRSKREEYENLLGYEVLESFDIPSVDLDEWRSSRLSSEPGEESLLLKPGQMAPIADMVRKIREKVDDPDCDLSRRQIERLTRSMRKFSRTDKSVETEIEKRPLLLDEFRNILLGDREKERETLYHLAALWDYIA